MGDAGPSDAGSGDAGIDAGPPDAGPPDAGIDAGLPDEGIDAGPPDAGIDAGPLDAGVDAGPTDGGDTTALFGRTPRNHRSSTAACLAPAPEGNCYPFTPAMNYCTNDSQCQDGPGGRCIMYVVGGCNCTYDSCGSDSDCPSNQTCACHGSPYTLGMGSRCVPGNCRTDADCGDGGFCSPTASDGCGLVGGCIGYYCHTPQDLCFDDHDCGDGGFSFTVPYCVFSPDAGRWECEQLMLPE